MKLRVIGTETEELQKLLREPRGGTMMKKYLKTKSKYFQETIDGKKLFEIRKNDRNFQSGEEYVLAEYEGNEYLSECPFNGECEAWKKVYETPECGEKEALDLCGKARLSCEEHEVYFYSGRECLIRIKDVFDLKEALLEGYVAFTFEILRISEGSRYTIIKKL